MNGSIQAVRRGMRANSMTTIVAQIDELGPEAAAGSCGACRTSGLGLGIEGSRLCN